MKSRTEYICSHCGYKSSGYLGKCPECGQFGTMEETKVESVPSATASPKTMMGVKKKTVKSNKLSSISKTSIKRISSGMSEFDRVMGGGIVSDSINIISAPPGMGKSTLLLQASNYIAETYGPVLYVCGEESPSQVRSRADRILGSISDNLFIYADTMLENIEQEILDIKPKLLVVDSLQMMYSSNCDGALYGDKQALTCVNSLISDVKTSGDFAVFLVGQMTKEDELRGSREIEHAVDAVFYLDSLTNSPVRMLKATKNRFGNTKEVGLFEMDSSGLNEIVNPSTYFTSLHKAPQIGCALSVIRDGTRSIVVETESISDNSLFAYPNRVARGISLDQLKVLLAILYKELGVNTYKRDVFTQISGGLRIKSESIALSVCASIYSSVKKIPIPQDTIFIGEIGLTGGLKRITDIDSIIKDCERFGFRRIIIPEACKPLKSKHKIDVVAISSLSELASIIK